MTTSKAKYKPGDIVLVQFPFTDLENSKKRPALLIKETVYSRALSLMTVAMITSQIELPEIEGDYEMKNWNQSGLLHPSRLRLAKIATLEESLVVSKLGSLQKADHQTVSKLFKKLFNYWL
jgi:mRNA interferase MazF